jgi:hypothetical protein
VGVGARNAHQVQRGLLPASNKELSLRVSRGAARIRMAGECAANIAEASLLVWVLQVARMLNQETQQCIGINGTGTSLDDDAAELDLVAGVGFALTHRVGLFAMFEDAKLPGQLCQSRWPGRMLTGKIAPRPPAGPPPILQSGP